MLKSVAASVALLTVVLVGCQRQSGRMHLYGSTRVPPPPTHSYSLPQTYYPNTPSRTDPAQGANGSTPSQSGPAQFRNTGAVEPIGSGVRTSLSGNRGVQIQGMPVNDATKLQPPGSLPTRPAYEPRSGMPAARGLQFIQRTSAEQERGGVVPASALVSDSRAATGSGGANTGPATSSWRSR